MKKIVVDASVAIKWFIPEIHAHFASRLLNNQLQLLAPDLIFAEAGNILWKKVRLQEISVEIGQDILNDFQQLPFQISESETLIDLAWHIATQYQRTFYDSLYLALAQSEQCLLVTADQKFFNALQATHLQQSLLWIEDIKDIAVK